MTRQEAPNYRDIVKVPICLRDMKNKTKRNEYKNREKFMEDVMLMRMNAVQFNGEFHPVSKIAFQLEDLARSEIEAKKGEIENLEFVVKEKENEAVLFSGTM